MNHKSNLIIKDRLRGSSFPLLVLDGDQDRVLKFGKTEVQTQCEYISAKVYAALGANVPFVEFVTVGKSKGLLFDFLHDTIEFNEYLKIKNIDITFLESFWIDALLFNRDVVGNSAGKKSFYNVLYSIKRDVLYRIDFGGTLVSSSRGTIDLTALDSFTTYDTLRDKAINNYGLFFETINTDFINSVSLNRIIQKFGSSDPAKILHKFEFYIGGEFNDMKEDTTFDPKIFDLIYDKLLLRFKLLLTYLFKDIHLG